MIPQDNITAWNKVVPWASQRQVEQDLIISRALVVLFSDPFLRGELRFRGGTALNKLHFPTPLRYSEDIDLVRTTAGPIRPVLDRVHDVLDPWLGKPRFDQSPVAPKLRYAVEAEDSTLPGPIKLKIEINTREREAYDPPIGIPFGVENPWFTGQAEISTYSREEMLATKLRALLQRNKGRDLFDLDHALTVFEGLNAARIVKCFLLYLERAEMAISRAEAQQRMFQKLVNPAFFTDMRPLLSTDRAKTLTHETLKAAFARVMTGLIDRIPGEEWAKVGEMRERFGVGGFRGRQQAP
jgi:predicted nucleotidyltransferase component of viral defense system